MKKALAVVAAQLLFVGILLQIAATNFFSAPPIYVETFDPPNTVPGTTDETSAITSAIAVAATTNGWVQLQNRQYYHESSFTVSSQVKVGGATYPGYASPGGIAGEANDLPLLISGSGATITVNGELSNFAQVRQGVSLNPANLQAEIANVAAFSGTGITLSANGIIRNAEIFGNATAIAVLNHANWYIDNVRGDDLAGLVINGMHNYSWANNINFQPFLAGQSSAGIFNVSGVANNGSGLIRITTSAAHNYITGNTATVYNVGGFVAANGTWTITVIDTTHFDLQSSAFAPSVSATTTSGSNVIAVSSTANLAVGQTITGTNITGTQTITNVSIPLSEITIGSGSNVTATGATTLTVANPSYTSGGTSTVSNTKRPGPCLSVTNSEAFGSVNFTCFGYDSPGVYLGTGAGWTTINNLAMESSTAGDPTSVAIEIGGTPGSTAYGSSINIAYLSTFWQAISVASTSAKPHHINGGEIYTTAKTTYGPPSVLLSSGATLIANASCGGNNDRFFVASGATLQMTDTYCGNAVFDFGSSFASVNMVDTPFSDFSGNTLRGSPVSITVPNASNNAFIQSLVASLTGIRFPLQSSVSAATAACTSNAENLFIEVTDALNPVVGSAVSGGGSTHVWTWCNGTAPIAVSGGTFNRTATGSVSNRTLASVAADVFNVKDYGAIGTGTATTIGTTYGSSLSAVAAYTTAAGATPFSWMNSSAYGLTFSMLTSAAQGTAGVTLPFSTALTGNPNWSQNAPQFNGFWPQNQQFLVLPGMTVSGYCIANGTTVASTAAANNGAKVTSAAQGSAGTTLTFLDTVGLVVGQPVTTTSGIPANTTIASLTATTVTLSVSTTAAIAAQTAIQFGEIANITLSQSTSSACAPGAAITFTLSNAQVQALTVDYVGMQSAFAAASSNGGGQVIAPAGTYEINRPVWNPGITNTSAYTPAIVFRGAGMYTTEISPTSDFGAGACALGESNRGPSATGYAEFSDFRLLGVGTANTIGSAVAKMDGLCIGAKDRITHVSAWLFNAGLNILNDHQIILDSDFGNNFFGIYMAPNGYTIGNQRIARTPTVGNALAGIAAAWNNGLVAATLSDSDIGGNSPYCFYQEAWAYGQSAYSAGLLDADVIQNMLGEGVGNGYIYTESGGSVTNNTFVGGQPVVTISSSSAVKRAGWTPRAVVYAAYFNGNTLVNADFSAGGANFALVTNGIFESQVLNNSFGDQTPMLTNLSSTIPAIISDNFGWTNGNSAYNSFSMGQASGEWRGVETAVTAGEIMMYGTGYGAIGARPMALGGTPIGVALVTSASATQVPIVEKGFINSTSKVTGVSIATGQSVCVSATTPTSVTLCSAAAGAGQFTIGGAVNSAGSSATSVWIDVQIVFNDTPQPFTVSTLPTCNSTTKALPGFYVTDATSPSYNTALTGGGSVVVSAWCPGSGSWVAH